MPYSTFFVELIPGEASSVPPQTVGLVKIIAKVLEEWLLQQNHPSLPETIFHVTKIPTISLNDYLLRCAKYLDLNDTQLIGMFIYIERFFEYSPHDYINFFNVNMLTLTALYMTHKFNGKAGLQSRYPSAGGVNAQHLERLETAFRKQINFNLQITEKEFLITLKKVSDFAQNFKNKAGFKSILVFSQEQEQRLNQLQLSELESNVRIVTSGSAASASGINYSQVGSPSPVPLSSMDTDEDLVLSTAPETAIKYDEPIRYNATSGQWFYKSSDAGVQAVKQSQAIQIVSQDFNA